MYVIVESSVTVVSFRESWMQKSKTTKPWQSGIDMEHEKVCARAKTRVHDASQLLLAEVVGFEYQQGPQSHERTYLRRLSGVVSDSCIACK